MVKQLYHSVVRSDADRSYFCYSLNGFLMFLVMLLVMIIVMILVKRLLLLVIGVSAYVLLPPEMSVNFGVAFDCFWSSRILAFFHYLAPWSGVPHIVLLDLFVCFLHLIILPSSPRDECQSWSGIRLQRTSSSPPPTTTPSSSGTWPGETRSRYTRKMLWSKFTFTKGDQLPPRHDLLDVVQPERVFGGHHLQGQTASGDRTKDWGGGQPGLDRHISSFWSISQVVNQTIANILVKLSFSQGQAHSGTKASKVVFIGDTGNLFTTGFSKYSDRQYAVWSQQDLKEPLKIENIDSSSGVLVPHFDTDTRMIYVAGKGDGNVRYYEVVDEAPWVCYLSQFISGAPQKGFGVLPKRGVNVTVCEVFRLFKLHATKVGNWLRE